ncbi:MAG: hypothetical protein KJO29_13950, partial [Bacteroidia bacterium]|nr:hypothetical protein [Bacteroidia bacterium]
MVSLDYSEEYLTSALQSNLDWIIKSFEINNNLGSSAYRTSWGTWAKPYPETTGYLIPSLLKASVFDHKGILKNLCLKQLEYFRDLQNTDGSFASSASERKPNVFDSAQILQGLMALYSIDGKAETRNMAEKCFHWLSSEIGADGSFSNYNLSDAYNPLYYTRISWILMKADKSLGMEYNEKTSLLFEKQLENWDADFIDKTAFYPGSTAFSHTVIYALRGLYECAIILNHKEALQKFKTSLHELLNIVVQSNGLPGQFYNSKYSSAYTCSTG